MHFAELRQNIGAQPRTGRPARMIPVRRVRADLKIADRRTGGFKGRQCIRLGVERIDRARRFGPATRSGGAGTQAGGDQRLVAWRVIALLGA
jgi:hypothetical protein